METPVVPSTDGSKAWQHPPYELISPQCKIAAAHNAQMEAKVAAVRADYDAKVAELMADLEATRGEKEQIDSELIFLKASSRTERLDWNKERKALNRKVAETDARAREAADGIASAEEFTALQKGLASREATIRSLREELDAKETQMDKLRLEAACGSTVQGDLDTLMVRTATLEHALAKERDARKTAEQEAETRSGEVRVLETRLKAALEAAARAEDSAAASIEDVSKITAEVRESRAGQRHAELWLEKSLAEVDAVHAVLAYERSAAAAAAAAASHDAPAQQQQQQAQYPVDHSMHTPDPTPKLRPHSHPPSPAYGGGSDANGSRCSPEVAVGPTAQTPTPESPTSILAGLGGGDGGPGAAAAAAAAAPPLPAAFPATPLTSPIRSRDDSGVRTPDLDVTRPELFSTTRLRSRVGGRGLGRLTEDGDAATDYNYGDLAVTTVTRRGGGHQSEVLSPPTPTVLFGELAGDGGSTTWGVSSTAAAAARPPHVSSGGDDGGGVDSIHGSAAAEVTATVKGTNNSIISSNKVREDVAASLLSMLRLETSKRKQAEARAAELEAASAAATAAAAAATTEEEETAAATLSSPPLEVDKGNLGGGRVGVGDGGVVRPCDEQAHGSGGGAPMAGNDGGQQQQKQPYPDWFAHYARVGQEKQEAEILRLVRDAREKIVSGGGGGGGQGCGGKPAPAGGGGPLGVESRSSSSSGSGCGTSNPSTEVASLIRQFDEKLTQSVEENTQLRVFCSHLEGLLASNPAPSAGGGARAGAALPTGGCGSQVDFGMVGCCSADVANGGAAIKCRQSPPFSLRRDPPSGGKARKAAAVAVAEPFQDLW
ncbi:unnamed protein product [Ectocarpus sp. 13 AM-2016]